MPESITLLKEEPKRRGIAIYITVSLCLHALFLLYWYLHRPQQIRQVELRPRYVELMSSQQFVEAPGAKLDTPAPKNAPFSDANRKASAPRATGAQQVDNPGDGRIFNDASAASNAPRSAAMTPPVAQPPSAPQPPERMPALRTTVASAAAVDWRGAIRDLANGPSLGSSDRGGDSSVGGEEGFAESGPISFETQWYDWGEYAESMVRRIRRNWYDNMPELIKVGMKGVVTIQFTIERSGAITNVTVISSSNIPPFDYAARHAIEITSPLAPLPADFPNPRERVTAQFYYNMRPPQRK